MDIKEIYEKLCENDVAIGNVELFLMEKVAKNRVYYFVDTGKVQNEVFRMIKDSVKSLSRKPSDQQPYDLISIKGVHYKLSLKEDIGYTEVKKVCKELFDYSTETINSIIKKDLKEINMKNLKSYIVRVKVGSEYLLFAAEISSLAKIKRTGFLANLDDYKLKKIEKDSVIGFNSEVGLMASEKEMLVIKPQMFESLFDIETEIEQKAKITFNELTKVSQRFSDNDIVHIRNIEKILEAAKQNQRINKRLAKLSKEEGLINALFENIEAVWKVLESEEFKDEFSSIEYNKETNTIIIESRSIDKFLTLLCDAPYESIIGRKKRLDRAR